MLSLFGTPRAHFGYRIGEPMGYRDEGLSASTFGTMLLIAPLCANTLAQAALGLCGNLLGSVLRAWYYALDDIFAAPLRARYGAHSISHYDIAHNALTFVEGAEADASEHDQNWYGGAASVGDRVFLSPADGGAIGVLSKVAQPQQRRR